MYRPESEIQEYATSLLTCLLGDLQITGRGAGVAITVNAIDIWVEAVNPSAAQRMADLNWVATVTDGETEKRVATGPLMAAVFPRIRGYVWG